MSRHENCDGRKKKSVRAQIFPRFLRSWGTDQAWGKSFVALVIQPMPAPSPLSQLAISVRMSAEERHRPIVNCVPSTLPMLLIIFQYTECFVCLLIIINS